MIPFAAALMLVSASAPGAAGPPPLNHSRPAQGMLLNDEYYCDNSKTVTLKVRQGLGIVEVIRITIGENIAGKSEIDQLNSWIKASMAALTSSSVSCETNGAVFYFKGTDSSRSQPIEVEARWSDSGMQRLL